MSFRLKINSESLLKYVAWLSMYIMICFPHISFKIFMTPCIMLPTYLTKFTRVTKLFSRNGANSPKNVGLIMLESTFSVAKLVYVCPAKIQIRIQGHT